jgi:nitroreductase
MTMDVYEALYTTRAMRRLKADPIPRDVQARILDAAIRAPSGGDNQLWRFMMVDSREVIGQLAPLFQDSVRQLWAGPYASSVAAAAADPEAESSKRFSKLHSSVQYLADHYADVPLVFLAFSPQLDTGGGGVTTAVWSAMLAARAEGVGSTLTGLLGMFNREGANKILGIPDDGEWRMTAEVPMGYPLGRWGVAVRQPAHEVSYRNQWGNPYDTTIVDPLWSS